MSNFLEKIHKISVEANGDYSISIDHFSKERKTIDINYLGLYIKTIDLNLQGLKTDIDIHELVYNELMTMVNFVEKNIKGGLSETRNN